MFEMKDGYRVVTKKHQNGWVIKYVFDEQDKPVAKRCTGCLEIKGLEQFSHKSENKFDGREPKCKKCDKQYREENKKHLAELAKKYYEENKERILERRRKKKSE